MSYSREFRGLVACGALLLLTLASACGGRSFTQDGGDAGSGQGGAVGTAGKASAGKNSGGAVSSGGKTGSAGTANVGGTGTSSAGAGTAGSGVAGAAGNVACTAPPVSGTCEAYIESWYHDPSTGMCRPFVYGGCDGNTNRYSSLADCQKSCSGGTPNYDACTVSSDCMIGGLSCCGLCESANLSVHELLVYNRKFEQNFQCIVPFEAPPDPGGMDAPACAPCPAVANGVMSYFVPRCEQGQCSVLDLRQSKFTACSSDDECRVRRGTSCCEECGNDHLIAVRNDMSVETLFCANSGPVPCPDCAPPSAGSAFCTSDGFCAVNNGSLD